MHPVILVLLQVLILIGLSRLMKLVDSEIKPLLVSQEILTKTGILILHKIDINLIIRFFKLHLLINFKQLNKTCNLKKSMLLV